MCAFIIYTDKATSQQKFDVPKFLATRPLLLKLKGKALFSFSRCHWLEISRHSLDQSGEKLLAHAFPRFTSATSICFDF